MPGWCSLGRGTGEIECPGGALPGREARLEGCGLLRVLRGRPDARLSVLTIASLAENSAYSQGSVVHGCGSRPHNQRPKPALSVRYHSAAPVCARRGHTAAICVRVCVHFVLAASTYMSAQGRAAARAPWARGCLGRSSARRTYLRRALGRTQHDPFSTPDRHSRERGAWPGLRPDVRACAGAARKQRRARPRTHSIRHGVPYAPVSRAVQAAPECPGAL